ncbi:MAG: YidC/Oxa1 family membrane protein insertase [Vigna little leaf phytoplasma]|nr:YidC/Oxa1 family membrane protein insertase [Vigna little leaf phytoplasma]
MHSNKKNMLINLFLVFLLMFFFNYFLFNKGNKKNQDLNIKFMQVIFREDVEQYTSLKNKINNIKEDSSVRMQNVDIFLFAIDKNKNLKIIPVTNDNFNDIKNDFNIKLDDILQGREYYLYYSDFNKYSELDNKQKIEKIKDFFTVKIGTNRHYLESEKYRKNPSFINLKFVSSSQILSLPQENLEIYSSINDTQSQKTLNNFEYNQFIKNKNTEDNIKSLYLKFKDYNIYFQILLDDSGDLPIQWPSKSRWGYSLGWGYIWNIFIIFIGFFLSFFSRIGTHTSSGIFFGNFGLGIILTTILVRTLLWPSYTKMNSFSIKMSLAQPEITKIQNKYALKKDKLSLQQMQMEIFKVYKKYNLSFFKILTTFLQIPKMIILIAMFRTLRRICVPGGIFNSGFFGNFDFSEKPFLGCVYLGLDNNHQNHMLTKILLSISVGITMFFLNKINLKKTTYKKQNTPILNSEQNIKQIQQEKIMKIVNHIMIFFMALAAYKELTMALYWLIGNLYTIFQTLVNSKMMEKKYYLLKKNNNIIF